MSIYEAAERLRDLPIWTGTQNTITIDGEDYTWLLAIRDAMLHELDPTPITEEWLRSLGAKGVNILRLRDSKEEFVEFHYLDTFKIWHVIAQTNRKREAVIDLRTCITTRGELRMLCRVLRIELKEA